MCLIARAPSEDGKKRRWARPSRVETASENALRTPIICPNCGVQRFSEEGLCRECGMNLPLSEAARRTGQASAGAGIKIALPRISVSQTLAWIRMGLAKSLLPREFMIAFAVTAIPITLLAVNGIREETVEGPYGTDEISYGLGDVWLVAAGLWLVAQVALCFSIKIPGKGRMAAGILAGLGVGFVALGTTCSSTIRFSF